MTRDQLNQELETLRLRIEELEAKVEALELAGERRQRELEQLNAILA